tara:strand:- start:957 stop:1259 length:303 start_codon:yes stop_codon:yes gene_type:complete
MSWENIVKEKFQGPAIRLANKDIKMNLKQINHWIEAIEEGIENEESLALLKRFVESLRERFDEMNDILIEQAKYTDRVDEKHIEHASAKYPIENKYPSGK